MTFRPNGVTFSEQCSVVTVAQVRLGLRGLSILTQHPVHHLAARQGGQGGSVFILSRECICLAFVFVDGIIRFCLFACLFVSGDCLLQLRNISIYRVIYVTLTNVFLEIPLKLVKVQSSIIVQKKKAEFNSILFGTWD